MNETASVAAKKQKAHWSYLPWEALEAVVRVFDFGAKKHAPRGWEAVPDAIAVYKDAAQRHLSAMMRGETTDPETGEFHAAHLACCALVIVWHEIKAADEAAIRDANSGGNHG